MRIYLTAAILALAFGAVSAAATPAGQAQAPPASQSGEKQAQKPAEKPKKVWTNDDLAELRSTVQVTTAAATPSAEGAASGEAASTPATGAAKEKELPPEKTAKFYKDKLDPKRKELAEVEKKIKEIQDALANPYNGTNKINTTQSAPPGPPSTPDSNPPRPDNNLYGNQIVRPQDQLTYYQKRRDELQQEIDTLEAQAISNGLSRGEIQ
ncbi:MAG TPA: hypothetical protein VLW54_07215 [Candidatus Acidoferrales bacterium]|nr:hypothetical protein [Candidatus Acidoferrales bacterium]